MNRALQPTTRDISNFSITPPQRTTLSNGIPLTVINAGEQEVVRLDIFFAGGRWRQSKKLQSVLTTRMLKEGSKQYVSAEIAEKLDYYGAWLELSSSPTHEFITLYSLNKHFEATLNLIESIIKEPTFPENEMDIIKNANIQQFLVNQTKVDFQSQLKLLNVLYGNDHPFGKITTESDYRDLSVKDLESFHNEFYNSANCSIFISGKVTDQILNSIESRFGTSTFGSSQPASRLIEYPIYLSEEKRFVYTQDNASQCSVRMGCHSIGRKHPDYLKYRVMVKLFGGFFGSRLMTNIREDKGYTYGISASTMIMPFCSSLVIGAQADSKYVNLLIDEVYSEIDKLHKIPVSEEELLIVKNYLIGDMCRSYESPFSLSDAWMFIQTSDLTDDYFTKAMDAVQNITAAEIQEMALKYLCKDNLKEVIVGNFTE